MEQFTLSSCETVSEQNMSETIICNHAALINPEEQKVDKCGTHWDFTWEPLTFKLRIVEKHKRKRIQ